ncbi:MAG: hypothetical protein F6K62_12350 [Sphaerospermopsis sp. SIO1G2]|nr:hypothetical protein [Sphaerospermopsis sp. SIO1G2]
MELSLYQYEQENFGNIQARNSQDLTGLPPILDHLNRLRESFRDNIPVSFVFIGQAFLINYFIRRCQDFFDWQSSTLKLTSIPSTDEEECNSNYTEKPLYKITY